MSSLSLRSPKFSSIIRGSFLFAPAQSGDDPADSASPRSLRPKESEDLPYKVELWNENKSAVEQVLAVTSNGSIGFAAYYAATREFPARYVTLSHKSKIVSRWNGPGH